MEGRAMSAQKEEKPVQTEKFQRIVAVASELFATRGFDGTSMRDVAEACEISKSLLYHHFANKEDLYRHIAFNATVSLYDHVEERIPADGPASEKVRAFMIATAEFFDKHRWAWIAATTAFWAGNDIVHRNSRMERRDSFERRLRALLEEGIDNGEFDAMDVPMTGRLILSSLNWMYKWYNPEKPKTPQEIASIYFDTILRGLAKR